MKKMCCFYASEDHLASILLPYINEKTQENQNVVTILEKNIGKSIKNLRKIMNIPKENWKKIENSFNNNEKFDEETIVIIGGSNEFIEKTKVNFQNSKILICCYKFLQDMKYIEKVLEENDNLLTTEGAKPISNLFTNIPKKSYTEITILK